MVPPVGMYSCSSCCSTSHQRELQIRQISRNGRSSSGAVGLNVVCTHMAGWPHTVIEHKCKCMHHTLNTQVLETACSITWFAAPQVVLCS